MILTLIALASAAPATDAAPMVHRVSAEHRGAPVDLVYKADQRIRTKEVGSSPPTRPSTVRCLWSVDLDVTRHVERTGSEGLALRHSFSERDVLSGARPGRCLTNRNAIPRDVAKSQVKIDAHVQTLAQRQLPAVLAELDATRALASN